MKIQTLFFLIAFLIALPLNLLNSKQEITYDLLYFHAEMRCPACSNIEEFTKRSINNLFDDELNSGTLKLTLVNFDLNENEELVEHYRIEAQTLIISKKVSGKEVQWLALEGVWETFHDYNLFEKYIKKELYKFMN